MGVGVVAGGPYWCSNGLESVALTSCMSYPSLIVTSELIAATEYAATLYSIDATSYMNGDKVWLFTGTKDTIVDSGVVEKLYDYYNYYTGSDNIKFINNYPSEHAFVTDNYGNTCDLLKSPYINNCDFDSAGSILNHIYGNLKKPTTAKSENIIKITQSQFTPFGYTMYGLSLYDDAIAYISDGCQNGTCNGIHIAFHGCDQQINAIGDLFYTKTGYNEWAESNNLIILYPQTKTNILNPKACWDWWGFTGENFATQSGGQMATVNNMVNYLVSKFM